MNAVVTTESAEAAIAHVSSHNSASREREAYAMLVAATPAAPPSARSDWRTPTSRLQRFTEAVTILCAGHAPPPDMVKAWLEPDSDDLRLQHFCATHGPSWAQGIVCLDAAAILADSPVEGVDDV